MVAGKAGVELLRCCPPHPLPSFPPLPIYCSEEARLPPLPEPQIGAIKVPRWQPTPRQRGDLSGNGSITRQRPLPAKPATPPSPHSLLRRKRGGEVTKASRRGGLQRGRERCGLGRSLHPSKLRTERRPAARRATSPDHEVFRRTSARILRLRAVLCAARRVPCSAS